MVTSNVDLLIVSICEKRLSLKPFKHYKGTHIFVRLFLLSLFSCNFDDQNLVNIFMDFVGHFMHLFGYTNQETTGLWQLSILPSAFKTHPVKKVTMFSPLCLKMTVTPDNVYLTGQALAFITGNTSSIGSQAVIVTANILDSIVNVNDTSFEVCIIINTKYSYYFV